MANNLSVTVSADVVDLQAKFAIAKAEATNLSAAMRALARSAAESGAGIDVGISAPLLAASEKALIAQGRVNALGAELGKLSPDSIGVRGIREIHAAITELAAGNLGALPGTFALLAHSIGDFGIAGVAGVAGVVGLGAALVELTRLTSEAQAAASGAAVDFAWKGIPETTAQVVAWTQEVEKIPGASAKAAEAYVTSVGEMQGATTAVRQAVIALAPELFQVFGPDATKQLTSFVAQWNDIQKKGGDASAVIRHLADQIHAAEAASNAAKEATKSWFDTLAGYIGQYGGEAAPGVELTQQKIDQLQAAQKALKDAQVGEGADAAGAVPEHDQWSQVLQEQLAEHNIAFDKMAAYERQFWVEVLNEEDKYSKEWWQAKEAIYKLDETAAREAAQKAAQADREAKSQQLQLATEDADHSVAMAKLKLDATKANLDDELAAHQISATERINQLAEATQHEYEIELDALQKRLALLKDEPVQQKRVNDQIETLTAQHNIQMERLATQLVAAQTKTDDQLGKSFKTAFVDPSERAFDQMVSGILQGTQTWQQTMTRALSNMLISELEADAKWAAEHALVTSGILAKDEATAKGGALTWILSEMQKTTATTSGVAVRTAAENAGQSSFIGRIGTMLGEWLGFETQKTATTITGEAAGRAAQIAGAFGEIEIDAAVAAAGAFAATAQIPYVGPELAPAAAAAAYAETMGWAAGLGGGIVSAAGGLWQVPSDQLAMIHQNETVMPAAIAQPMRNFFTGAASSSGAGTGGGGVEVHFHIDTMDGASAAAFFNKNGRSIARTVSQYITNNPSMRPAY
jgi:hypothetical protein